MNTNSSYLIRTSFSFLAPRWAAAKVSGSAGVAVAPRASRQETRERLSQLESRVERIDGFFQTLTKQLPPHSAPSPQTQPFLQRVLQDPAQAVTPAQGIAPLQSFDPTRCFYPPPEVLSLLVDVHIEKIHGQPLPLFDKDKLCVQSRHFPDFLLQAFLALTLLFAEPQFYRNAKKQAIDLYLRSARPTVIQLAAEGTPSLPVLQALCLLTLCDLAAGRHARVWMNVGIAARLVLCFPAAGTGSATEKDSSMRDDQRRCCWSVYILERVFAAGPSLLGSSSLDPLSQMGYPASPPRPRSLVANDDGSVPNAFPTIRAAGDLGIQAYCLQVTGLWYEVLGYLRERLVNATDDDPWIASSRYHTLVAHYYEFETGISQRHRYRNLGFHTITASELLQHKEYWTAWLYLQVTFHAGQALLHHPLFHITHNRRASSKLPPPSFLQQTIDQSLLHAGWPTRLVRTWGKHGIEVNDPFLGQLVATAASIHWIFQFASERTIADRARADFEQCRRFLTDLMARWPHVAGMVDKLGYLQSLLSTQGTGTSSIPPFKWSAMWDLLDPHPPHNSVEKCHSGFVPGGQPLSTQYLVPLRESSPDRSASWQDDPVLPSSEWNNSDLFNLLDIPYFGSGLSQPGLEWPGEL
ncbi:uncharacterized protein BP01DRAFT_379016 [Aspergillus saccharolyticus JOP 1030-1]|uniref:Xylanolytic transcriptional activator regulatory domain-containing protein n=1 Tax=Aspergillus saccharolyticus JOP 1030-1 TaxID=1450539 RepID=A0A319ACY4_9EURO|nr:hypothetical protein BP01DRAFT_379016 [Aspergillus saccharolyticus JOP 1030-1]PYH49448.1 hypothetical protein BP01DRAFT_379016 [Aspergillus saccharolyticus JOP 1030-1]